MSKNRTINTKFWDDSYIINLDPTEKLLYLYLLTNPLTDLCGIYEIPLRRIAFDTGFEKEMVQKILDRFARDGKMFYFEGWVVIKNFIKNQSLNPSIKKGIERSLSMVPEKVWLKIKETDSLSTLCDSLVHLNLNLNLDLNSNLYLNAPDAKEEGDKEIKKIQKQKTDALFEKYIELKGWGQKPRKEINALYPRVVKTLRQILELVEWEQELAVSRMVKVATWADSRDLDWATETVIKKWMEIDDLPQERDKKPYIEGDRAYQKDGNWWVITRSGEHKKYIGSLEKLVYV